MNMTKRTAALFLAAVLFLTPAAAAPEHSARSAILLDAMTGRVLYEHNADAKSLIASTTKIMTGLLIAEQCSEESRVEIPPQATGIEGSSLYLQAGEVLSMKELLYGMLLHSGNDAATALAIHLDGSTEAFAARMNEKARQLGLDATQFANPHGLDSEHNYSTARDLAHLAAYALEHPLFREVVSTKAVTVGHRVLQNHNKLLWRYDGAMGVKTGYTKAAGRILVSAAERSGRRLVAVTLNDPKDWDDHIRLLDYGFDRFVSKSVLTADEPVAHIPVLSGSRRLLAAAAKETVACPVAEGETVIVRLHLPKFVFAPIEEGTYAGQAEILIGGTVLASVPLYWQDSAEQLRR